MHTLISFATRWGSKHGGINSFNTGFLEAFGFAYHNSVQVICIVADANHEEIEKARNSYVTLLKLPTPPSGTVFAENQARTGIDALNTAGIPFDPAHTVWLGHDRITGAAAIEAAKQAGGRSALIHHMSYDHYESFAEDSQTAYAKTQTQRNLFKQADLVLAIGPLLRNAAQDLIGDANPVHMLVPGLAEIDVFSTPRTFVAFLSGRLDENASRIKQGHLGIAAFAAAYKKACAENMPDALCKQPKLMLRGVDFTAETTATPTGENPETELKLFAEKYAGRAVNLQALPYTEDRDELYDNLRRSSVAMMPSWHEGFGLVAWEAIAAGVPLIVSRHSGVYQLLEEEFPGTGTGCVYPVDILGSSDTPFFQEDDLNLVANTLREIAHQPEKARKKAANLRELLLNTYTWPACVAQAASALGWELQIGSLPPIGQEPLAPPQHTVEIQTAQDNLPVRMPASHWQRGGLTADSQLLRAEEALVPFDPARQPELDKLDAWLNNTEFPLAVRLLTGAGGLGKTRLALELCQRQNASGWHAGFLDSELETSQLSTGWKALQALNQPLLIVIDYAETRQTELLRLTKAIRQSPASHPVRLLLLARDGGEWWDNLPGKDKDCEPLLSGYATSGPFHLPPLHNDIPNRRHAYKQALNAFAQALKVPAPEAPQNLEDEHFGRPLYLQMAALLALRGERPTTAQGLTRALLNHERRYWHGLISPQEIAEPERHAEQLLALSTLAGGFPTDKTALSLWESANGKVLTPAQFKQLFHALIPLYPGKQGLQAVRPDLLGEALVAQALLRPSAGGLLDAVLGKDASQIIKQHALTVIARLSNHYQELHEVLIEALVRHFPHCWREFISVATGTPSKLPALAVKAFERLPEVAKDQLAGLLKPYVQQLSIQLAEFYCAVSGHELHKHRQKYIKKQNDFSAQNDYCKALARHANCLDNVGDNEAALRHDKLALETARQSTPRKSNLQHESWFAGISNNYANRLSDAGRHDEALEHAQQALEICQRLAEKNPDRFEPDWAMSLNNYANRLSDAGRHDEALEHAQQALEIRQRLAEKNPDRFEPDWAMSLNNYANRLGDVGRHDEALEHAQQALEISQRLAEKNPDRFEPDWAMSLNNYANRLGDVGRHDEALELAQQALEIRQRLARKTLVRFADNLFSAICFAHFLEWLTANEPNIADIAEPHPLLAATPRQRLPLLRLYAAFVRSCAAHTAVGRAEGMKQVITLWGDLSRADQLRAQAYWLCAAAWCATHEPPLVAGVDWQTEWRAFREQRQGHVPRWMLEVARRLEFGWES